MWDTIGQEHGRYMLYKHTHTYIYMYVYCVYIYIYDQNTLGVANYGERNCWSTIWRVSFNTSPVIAELCDMACDSWVFMHQKLNMCAHQHAWLPDLGDDIFHQSNTAFAFLKATPQPVARRHKLASVRQMRRERSCKSWEQARKTKTDRSQYWWFWMVLTCVDFVFLFHMIICHVVCVWFFTTFHCLFQGLLLVQHPSQSKVWPHATAALGINQFPSSCQVSVVICNQQLLPWIEGCWKAPQLALPTHRSRPFCPRSFAHPVTCLQ